MRVDPVKAAKAAAILSVVVTVVGTAWLIVRWLGGSGPAPAILAEPGIVARLRAQRPTGTTAEQQESALVGQARLFALGINPPPPPPPPRPERTTPAAAAPREASKPEPPKPTNVTFTAKSKLLATAVYPDYPEKSLALLDMGNIIGLKWVRIGESVNHQTVHEIHPDRVVLAHAGRMETVPIQSDPPKPYKSLIAQADAQPALGDQIGSIPAISTAPGVLPEPTATVNGGRTEAGGASRAAAVPPSLSSRTRAATPTSIPTRTSGTDRTFRTTPVPPSPQERLEMADQNITDIKKLIKESDSLPGVSEEEKARERELWNKLLQIMEQEKQRITEPPPETEKSEPIKTR